MPLSHMVVDKCRLVPLFVGLVGLLFVVAEPAFAQNEAAAKVDFVREIQPLLLAKCSSCHGETSAKSGLRLDLKAAAIAGGDSGAVIVPRDSQKSPLYERIHSSGDDRMPPEGDPLSEAQIDLIKHWIDQGADWPDGVDKARVTDRYDWWSLKPMVRPVVPRVADAGRRAEPPSPIDAFVLAKLREQGLSVSPSATRRTLIRRVYYDLIGLPPSPEEVEAFESDPDPHAYARLVDRLLESPHYGERWARHWLDIVHYGDTHGYDKDQPRPNAWPYRDYVIRAFNSDKPYSRFVEEQLAGDILAPETEDGLTATGFIAAGPWDLIGHAEVPETKIDGMIARNLDRDDMVANTCNTFLSLTVQCARCHNHKFDPVAQEDYYRLQAVFAALDRADRTYDTDPTVMAERITLNAKRKTLLQQQAQFTARINELGGETLKQIDQRIASASQPGQHPLAAQFGYHSQIEPTADQTKWVQVDLGSTQTLATIQIFGCHDDFNNIGAGFGFPVRLKVELSDDEGFQGQSITVADLTEQDLANPGVKPLTLAAAGKAGRYLRVTATRLALRQNDYIFALAELTAINESGRNVALGRPVTALDSIEALPRWSRSNLVDGYSFGIAAPTATALGDLKRQREEILATVVDEVTRSGLNTTARSLAEVEESLKRLPPPKRVYAGMIHTGTGTFTGTGPSGGKPRPIHVLARGNVSQPQKLVGPGVVPLSKEASSDLSIPAEDTEGQRRVALAKWITSADNPLTWRSIVNRVWLYHFGRGIVDSPNDFGRMGQVPSHPELLDWLAIEFRDNGQSLKQLHRMILNSETYCQVSTDVADSMGGADEKVSQASLIDSNNVYLWRMNRRKLEAEAVRDATIAVAGKLNRTLGGPAFQDFVVEKPEHSPHYEYQLHDPDDERIHRRSVYRFLVRSQPQPFMTALDCADPSMSVDKRNETLTALQALALLNNRLMLTMARHLAARVESSEVERPRQIAYAFRLALSRPPTAAELAELTTYAERHGMVSACRLLLNLNEFVFVD